ncbi:MAG: alpha/beta hydrolase [Microbacterium sp.]|uniref:alpha/beta fold hydrolase n=1 Tax=Microbacterium sp. TaxID=51671 RepID=UPI0027193215|nr:alpha/beta hydrolase [Microbacterium sp.]MDO8383536.1 alpha/beta hydrolase [Microbacterium sp.]
MTRYLEAGSLHAPPLLLLHDGAWGGSSDVTWSDCILPLAKNFHVFAPDFLGFGGSSKITAFDQSSYTPRIEQLLAFVAHLGIDAPVHVAGSSYGGSVALRLVADGRLPLASVVSIGGSGGKWKTPIMIEELGRWDGSREDLLRVVRYLRDDADIAQEQLERRLYWATRPGHYRSLASAGMPIPDALRTSIADDWPASLAESNVPTLLIAGDRDDLFDPEWPDHVAASLGSAGIVRVDARHSPNLDHPEPIVHLIASHALEEAGARF